MWAISVASAILKKDGDGLAVLLDTKKQIRGKDKVDIENTQT